MTTITRIDPFRELASLFESWAPTGKDQLAAGTFVPPVDVYEDEHTLVLKLEVPGVNEEDLNVSVEDNTLTVQGERKFEKEEKEEKREGYYQTERIYGSFYRALPLPEGVNIEKAKAVFRGGVLEITAPMEKVESKTRKLEITETPDAKTVKAA